MTAPTIDNFPALGFVPCPGDHNTVTGVVHTLKMTTDALGEAVRVLRGAGQGTWRGKTADAFRELLSDDFRPKVETAFASFDEARRALNDWAEFLLHHQAQARQLEEKAAAAKRKADQAKQDDKSEKADGKNATSGRGDSEEELEEIRRQARKLMSDFEAEGADIARRLKHAGDIAPNEPGFWDKLGDKIGGVLDEIGDAIKENADWITVAASVVGVAAIFFPALAPVAIALSVVAFTAHAAKYQEAGGLFPPSKENIGNYLTLGGDLLGVIPGVGAVGKGAMAGFKAARGAGGIAKGTKVGITTMSKVTPFEMKAASPALPAITRSVEAVSTKLGASTINAQRIADGVQAAAALTWTAPTAYSAAKPSDSASRAANWGTTAGNYATGAGSKAGAVVAIGSLIGLGMWETR